MEKDIGYLPMDGDVRCCAFGNRIWRGGDILIFAVFIEALVGIGSDGLYELSVRPVP